MSAEDLARCERLGIRLVQRGESGYPERLRELAEPPQRLYVQGALELSAPVVAIVGARRSTPYGEHHARRMARDLARAGCVIVSGLARGIDAQAHLGALDAGGPTWAVLGSGLARLYPPEHVELSRRIVSGGGALISEYPLDYAPEPRNFPHRNRIVAALAHAVVLIEGRHGSGSLVTAERAAELSRAVFALPGPVGAPNSQAPNRLLREGGWLAESAKDVLEMLGGEAPPFMPPLVASSNSKPASRRPALPSDHAKILECLGLEGLTLEEAAAAVGLDFARLSTIIFELELQRLVRRLPGQRYAQNPL